jgi:hypothetical protein
MFVLNKYDGSNRVQLIPLVKSYIRHGLFLEPYLFICRLFNHSFSVTHTVWRRMKG